MRCQNTNVNPSLHPFLSLSTNMNPPGLDFDFTSSLSPLLGCSWMQPPVENQFLTPYMSSEGTHMEIHPDSRLHFTPAGEVTIGSLAIAEFAETRNKKRKGKEVEKRNKCERKRRSRIADRMKTLQELIPNSSYKLSAASVLDKAIGYIKTLQLQKAVLGYQQMMMDGLLMPTHNFPVRESAWNNSSDSILMTNCERDSTINPSTHPGLSHNTDGIMPDPGILLQLLQSPPLPMPLFDGFGGLLSSAAASSPTLQPVSAGGISFFPS